MKYKFFIKVPTGEYMGRLKWEEKEAGVIEGTEQEAVDELRKRINRTWSPYVFHHFEKIKEDF